MKKNITTIGLCFTLLISLASCGSVSLPSSNNSTGNSQSSGDSTDSSPSSGDSTDSSPSSSEPIEDVYFNCIFKNEDAILYSTSVKQGETVIYPYDDPVKDATSQLTYTFIGWDNSLENIQQDIVFVAQFSSSDTLLVYSFDSYAGNYYVKDCPESAVSIIISSTYNDGTNGSHSVTSISNSAFRGCSSLTSITIPSGVTSIGSYAFRGCSSLTSISVDSGNTIYKSDGNCLIEISSKTLIVGCKNSIIPTDGSVTSIGRYAFYDCSSLTSITIPSSITSIGSGAFYGCSSLTSISVDSGNTRYKSDGNCLIEISSKTLIVGCKNSIIPTDGSVTSIGDNAFFGCSSLTSITIPSSVTFIGSGAFYDCSSLTSITIPSSVTSIGSVAFYDCSSLTSISVDSGNTIYKSDGNCLIKISSKTLIAGCKNSIIPTDGSVTSIGSYAFYDCSSLTSITIPSSVTSIGYCAFSGCSSLTSLTIGSSVTSIGGYAFYDCSSLTSITIPSGVTSIGDNAFFDCSSLTSITIPSSVTSIGDNVFYDCSSLKIYCEATSQPSNWRSLWNEYGGTAYWYSETSNTDGSHWRYVDGVPTVWTK